MIKLFSNLHKKIQKALEYRYVDKKFNYLKNNNKTSKNQRCADKIELIRLRNRMWIYKSQGNFKFFNH